jgi:OOP family OmpA-OmpF porin
MSSKSDRDKKWTKRLAGLHSLRRADEIKDYLVANGISSNLIEVHGYGLSKPIASNATREGRAKNRRVEVVVKAVR